MRGWQIRKLRLAGLDPYMRATWQEAQAHLRKRQERDQAQAEAAHQRAEWERRQAEPTQQMSAVIDAPPAKPRSGKPLRACPHCGREFKALHWHTPKCKMRPAA